MGLLGSPCSRGDWGAGNSPAARGRSRSSLAFHPLPALGDEVSRPAPSPCPHHGGRADMGTRHEAEATPFVGPKFSGRGTPAPGGKPHSLRQLLSSPTTLTCGHDQPHQWLLHGVSMSAPGPCTCASSLPPRGARPLCAPRKPAANQRLEVDEERRVREVSLFPPFSLSLAASVALLLCPCKRLLWARWARRLGSAIHAPRGSPSVLTSWRHPSV